ncbi:MAG: phosphatase PAP2 family protein [Myxococcota bacterium]|nr:phosphatase PAP2 family protein [Myxococcota bacterium]
MAAKAQEAAAEREKPPAVATEPVAADSDTRPTRGTTEPAASDPTGVKPGISAGESESPLGKTDQREPQTETHAEPVPFELPALNWKPEWARVGTGNYVFIGAAAAVSVGASIIRPLGNHNLEGPILFDASVRRALRFDSLNARYASLDLSDIFLSLEITWPFAVDALVMAGGVRRSPDVAWEMAVIDAEAVALTTAVHQITTLLVSRPRPYLENCGDELSPDLNLCVRNGRYRSFFSGHAAMSFTGASLICAHRFRHEIFGAKADILTCATAYVAAAATASMRVIGDVHNASDVITGAVIGTAIGLAVPALHYRSWDRTKRGAKVGRDYEISVYPTQNGIGLAVVH